MLFVFFRRRRSSCPRSHGEDGASRYDVLLGSHGDPSGTKSASLRFGRRERRHSFLNTISVPGSAADYALCASGSQMLILRVSGIRNRPSTKHTMGTAIG